jgi:hypothetical protein
MLYFSRELSSFKQIGTFGKWPNRRSSRRGPIDRHGCRPLKFVPTHEAEAASAARKSLKKQPTDEAKAAEAAYAVFFP